MYREKAVPSFALEGTDIEEIGVQDIDLVLHKSNPKEGTEKLNFKEFQIVEHLRHAMYWVTQDTVYPPIQLKAYRVEGNIKHYRLKYFSRRKKFYIIFFVDTDENLIVISSLTAISTRKKK